MSGLPLNEGTGLFEFLDRIRSNDGLLVLILIALIAFGCYLLSNLAWKVWRAALEAKEREIRRLAHERDKYQAIVFERLLPTEIFVSHMRGWPEDEGGGGGKSSLEKVH
jgi:hypothetical protein